jgi:hypothetical protein
VRRALGFADLSCSSYALCDPLNHNLQGRARYTFSLQDLVIYSREGFPVGFFVRPAEAVTGCFELLMCLNPPLQKRGWLRQAGKWNLPRKARRPRRENQGGLERLGCVMVGYGPGVLSISGIRQGGFQVKKRHF